MKKLNEAGSFGKLTPQEVQSLRSYSPQFGNAVGQIVSSFRQKGKQIDLGQAVEQLKQVGYNSPEIDKFINASKLTAPIQGVQANPFAKRDSVPGAKPVVPPQSAQGQLTPKNEPIKQRLQMATQKQPAQPQAAGATPFDQFEKIRTNPNVSNDDVIAQGRTNQPAAPVTNRQQLKDKWSAKGPVDPFAKTSMAPVREAMGIMNSKVSQVMDILKRLKPDELMAITNMINSLNSGGRMGASTMRSSTINAGKVSNLNSKQKLMTEILVLKITEQKKASATAQQLLEGPLGNVWDQIKGAGTALGQKMGLMGQSGQEAQMAGVDENSKRAAQEMQKVLGKVNQFRSKFNSSILKNSESMNGYHDLVLNAVQMYKQYQNILGPFGQQLAKQIHDAVGQLVYDLSSEKEQIDAFLKQLNDVGIAKTGKSLGREAKKKAEVSRAAENPDAGAAGMRRHMPMGGGGVDPRIADDLTKSQALNKARSGDQVGGMNDMQKLFMKQIEREKAGKSKKKPAKKSAKKK